MDVSTTESAAQQSAFPQGLVLNTVAEGRGADIRKEKLMRTFFALTLAVSALVAAMDAAPAAAEQRCRMEQQCRWVNFKKICHWVRVCRDR
jgi:hypothetical protein